MCARDSFTLLDAELLSRELDNHRREGYLQVPLVGSESPPDTPAWGRLNEPGIVDLPVMSREARHCFLPTVISFRAEAPRIGKVGDFLEGCDGLGAASVFPQLRRQTLAEGAVPTFDPMKA